MRDGLLSADYDRVLREIMLDPRYQSNLSWGEVRPGHPEGTVAAHIQELERNLDACEHLIERSEISKLKVLIHTHDTFKSEAQPGVAITSPNSHASLARAFLERFVNDKDLLKMVQYHDEPIAIWKRIESGKEVDQNRLKNLLTEIKDLKLFATFVAIDGITQGKDPRPVRWFLTTLVERGICDAEILGLVETLVLRQGGGEEELVFPGTSEWSEEMTQITTPGEFVGALRRLVEEIEEREPVPVINLTTFLSRFAEQLKNSDMCSDCQSPEQWSELFNSIHTSLDRSTWDKSPANFRTSGADLDIKGAKKLLDSADLVNTKDALIEFINLLALQAEHPFSAWANSGLYSFLDGIADSTSRVLLNAGTNRELTPKKIAQLFAQAAFFE